MKKIAIALLVMMTVATGSQAIAQTRADHGTYEFSGALDFATGPDTFDDSYGLTFGAGYMLNNISRDLQARIDISYFPFEQDVANTNVDYTRVPINISGRYYIPLRDRLNLFAEAGLEVSFDEAEFVDVLGVKHSESDTNWGVTPGFGAEYFVSQDMSIFALGRFHVITDDYFSTHFGAAFHF